MCVSVCVSLCVCLCVSMCVHAYECVVLGRYTALLSRSWDVVYGPVLCILGASEGLEETGEKFMLGMGQT